MSNSTNKTPLAPKNSISLSDYAAKDTKDKIWVCGRIKHLLEASITLYDINREIMFSINVKSMEPEQLIVFKGLKTDDIVALYLGDNLEYSLEGNRCTQFIKLIESNTDICTSDENTKKKSKEYQKKYTEAFHHYHKNSKIIKKFKIFEYNIKTFFLEQKFTEAETPFIVSNPGSEPYLDPLQISFLENNKKKHSFLPTSPELHLKKLLSFGEEKIFEIKTCFRGNERGFQHQTEFKMLEWYRAFSRLDQIAEDIQNLIVFLNKNMNFNENFEFESTTVRDLFSKYINFELTPKTTRQDLAKICIKLKIDTNENMTWDDLFFLIFLEKIEPQFIGRYLFVYDYPPKLSALSSINSNGWASRFEFYINGVEIANAYQELNNLENNIEVHKRDMKSKKILNKKIFLPDQLFFESLKFGIPPAAGVALGIERLFMALFDIDDIKRLRAFPRNI